MATAVATLLPISRPGAGLIGVNAAAAADPELSRAAAASEKPSPPYDADDVVVPLLVEAVVELSDAMLLVLPVLLVLREPLLVVLSEPLLVVLLPIELLDVVLMLLLALALIAGGVCMMIWTFAPDWGVAVAALLPPLLIRMKAAICDVPEACSKAPVHRLLPELEPLPDELVLLVVLPDEFVLAAALPLSIDEVLDVALLLVPAVPPLDDRKLPLQPASGSIVW